jgi:nicotinamidase-related amidase
VSHNSISPDFAKAALITIDTQVDTLDGQPLEIPGTSGVVPSIAQLCETFRQHALPIVHMVRLYLADGSNAEPSRKALVSGAVPILRPGCPGRRIAPEILSPDSPELDDEILLRGEMQDLGSNEVAIYKPRWGAFYRTPLEVHLESLGVDTLVFTGCNFPNCPRTSIYEASERDFRIVLVDDAVSGLYDKGRQELLGIGVSVMKTPSIVASIETSYR